MPVKTIDANCKAMLIRVSTDEQNLARQLEVAQELGIPAKNIFREHISGATPIEKREVLQSLISWCRNEDDHVYFASIDRGARSLVELQKLVKAITATGASVTFVKENLTFSNADDTMSATSKLLFHILGAFAEFERELIRERQAQGIKVAMEKGVYKERCGRKRVPASKYAEVERLHVKEGMSYTKACVKVGVSKAGFFKFKAGQAQASEGQAGTKAEPTP